MDEKGAAETAPLQIGPDNQPDVCLAGGEGNELGHPEHGSRSIERGKNICILMIVRQQAAAECVVVLDRPCKPQAQVARGQPRGKGSAGIAVNNRRPPDRDLADPGQDQHFTGPRAAPGIDVELCHGYGSVGLRLHDETDGRIRNACSEKASPPWNAPWPAASSTSGSGGPC